MIWPPGYCHFSKEQCCVCIHQEAVAAGDGESVWGSLPTCMKLPFPSTVGLLWKNMWQLLKTPEQWRHHISCFYQETLRLSRSRDACESWAPRQGGRLSASHCYLPKVTCGRGGPCATATECFRLSQQVASKQLQMCAVLLSISQCYF